MTEGVVRAVDEVVEGDKRVVRGVGRVVESRGTHQGNSMGWTGSAPGSGRRPEARKGTGAASGTVLLVRGETRGGS